MISPKLALGVVAPHASGHGTRSSPVDLRLMSLSISPPSLQVDFDEAMAAKQIFSYENVTA